MSWLVFSYLPRRPTRYGWSQIKIYIDFTCHSQTPHSWNSWKSLYAAYYVYHIEFISSSLLPLLSFSLLINISWHLRPTFSILIPSSTGQWTAVGLQGFSTNALSVWLLQRHLYETTRAWHGYVQATCFADLKKPFREKRLLFLHNKVCVSG